MRGIRGWLMLVCCLVLQSAAWAGLFSTEVKGFYLTPPRNTMDEVTRIAVMNFAGELGPSVTDQVINGFVQEYNTIKGRSFAELAKPRIYEVIERTRMEELVREQSLSLTGMMDVATAVRLGGIMGVDAVMIGDVSVATQDSHEDREETYTEDKQEKTRLVRYYKRELSGKINARLVRTSNGQVIHTFAQSATRKDVTKNRTELKSVEQLSATALQEAGLELYTSFYPAPHSYEVELVGGKEFRAFNDLLEKVEYDKARALALIQAEKNAYSPEWAYNLGITCLLFGRPDLATAPLEKALQLKPDKREFKNARDRAVACVAAELELRKAGYLYETREFDDQLIEQVRAQADRRVAQIKSKGVQALAEGRAGAAVVAELPKGIAVEVLQESKDYVQIRLIDGKEVWVARKQLKMEE